MTPGFQLRQHGMLLTCGFLVIGKLLFETQGRGKLSTMEVVMTALLTRGSVLRLLTHRTQTSLISAATTAKSGAPRLVWRRGKLKVQTVVWGSLLFGQISLEEKNQSHPAREPVLPVQKSAYTFKTSDHVTVNA